MVSKAAKNLNSANKPTSKIKSSLKKLSALVWMQLKETLDLSWAKSKKLLIRKIVFSIIAFALITYATSTIVHYCAYLNVFYPSDIIVVAIVFFTLMLILSILSCTVGLMKNLFISEDNKVLTTFPVTGGMLFSSKLIVYYIYEVKKAMTFFVPVLLGFLMEAESREYISIGAIFFAIIPMLFVLAVPVLIGGMLSIPALYINRLFNRFPLIQFLVVALIVAAGIYGVVTLINMIPENIDFINQWPTVARGIRNFLRDFVIIFDVFAQLMYILIGSNANSIAYVISGATILNLFLFILAIAALIGLNYLLARPLFFHMMSKSFEFDKKEYDVEKKNKVRKPLISFIHKELIISIRSVEVSANYIAVYIAIPILILFINSFFAAMNTKLSGDIMIYAFNLLLILLPLLASNSLIATLYSKEGRAGYMKKTKPINPLMPLMCKLLFNLVLSIPCVVMSIYIFATQSHFDAGCATLLAFGVLFIQYGHIFYCAALDIMNPQNEQYATSGESISNPNENKSTVVAFVGSFIFALISFKLFTESNLATNSFMYGSLKLMLIGLAVFGSSLMMFVLKVKAYYYDK